jgi:dolichol-phosphate mannosyltransferase
MLNGSTSMRIHPTDCTLIIPAYNEENRIGSLLGDISGFAGEIIFVCDGGDRTQDVISSYAKDHPEVNMRCLTFPDRLGKGGGILAGMRAASTPFVGYMDADGSTGMDQMLLLFDRLSSVDGAIGSRWVPGSVLRVRQSIWRQLESRAFNLLVRTLFGLRFKDTQCGAKAFRRAALEPVIPEIISRGFEFDVELLWRLKQHGSVVEEVSTIWENRNDSTVTSSDAGRMLRGMLSVRFRTQRKQ